MHTFPTGLRRVAISKRPCGTKKSPRNDLLTAIKINRTPFFCAIERGGRYGLGRPALLLVRYVLARGVNSDSLPPGGFFMTGSCLFHDGFMPVMPQLRGKRENREY